MNKLGLPLKILILFFVCTFTSNAQLYKTDSVGNFYLKKNKLIWQKSYYLHDINALDEQLKSNPFTSKLRILDFGKDVVTDSFNLISNNLPQYARSNYTTFLVIDIYQDYFRVTIQNITFPDFVENHYYNGMRQNSRTGALENYILRNDGLINRTSANLHVLHSFDTSFEDIFETMAEPFRE
ncbi:hypothetical protein MNBD_BACTEROID02-2010 [hydrothermal vent metagenome]|uniref:Uncharacterized protein n=1 Tax=hydrothermal vent metagenome TaxID=652676 RepID=A0A3B0QT64_9ZZZZ